MSIQGPNKQTPPEGFEQIGLFKNGIGWIGRIAWSPDGGRIASASEDRKVRIWTLNLGERQETPSVACEGHTSIVYSVAWSPDGERVASVSEDMTLQVWNIKNAKRSRNDSSELNAKCEARKKHPDSLYSVAWSPDGQVIAVGCRKGYIYFYQVENRRGSLKLRKRGRTTDKHTHGVNDLAWSLAEPHRLASVSGGDGRAFVWDVSNLDEPHKIAEGPLHGDGIQSVAWSPDGAILATASADRSVGLWSFDPENTGEAQFDQLLPHFQNIATSVCFSSDGDLLATKAEAVVVYRKEGNEWKQTMPLMEQQAAWYSGLAFHPNLPNRLATLGESFYTPNTAIRVWDIDPSELETPYDVFFSFRHGDLQQVDWIKEEIEQQGLDVWIYTDDQSVGNISANIAKVLKASRTLVCFVGQGGFSQWQIDEINFFLEITDRHIIPVILSDVGPEEEFPELVKPYVGVDFRRPHEKPVDKLTAYIRAGRNSRRSESALVGEGTVLVDPD